MMKTLSHFTLATLLILFTSKAFALDFTQTTKDTIFILSDENKTMRVNLDNFAVRHELNLSWKNETGKEIINTGFYYTGVGDSLIEDVTTDTLLYNNITLYKTWDLTLGESSIEAIKNDGGKKFTVTTDYLPDAEFKGAFVRGNNEWLPQRTLHFCWESCPENTNLTITSTNTLNLNEGESKTHTLIASNTTASFSLVDNPSNLFSLNDNALTFNGTTTDFESATKSYTVKVKASIGTETNQNIEQMITVNLTDLNDETPATITFTGNRTLSENTTTGTELGTLSAIDADANDTFTYTSSNTAFTIDNNKLKLNTALDYETAPTLSTKITVIDGNHHSFDKTFHFTVSDINDNAPTNITLSNNILTPNAPAGTIIGTLSATDADTNRTLTYSVNDTTHFEIIGNQLKIKTTATAITFPATITITVSDGTNTTTHDFTLSKTTVNLDITPVIKQFIVTQGANKGRIISKNGGTVTVSAIVNATSYEWSSSDFSTITTNDDDTMSFAFDPKNASIGIRTIKLKVTTGTHSSERLLKLKLIAVNVSSSDQDGDGIPDNKDIHTENNKLQAGIGKTISSQADTRILLGIMGKDSGRLTLAQMKQYIIDNGLPNKSDDTLATGDIYDFIIEGLNATGDVTQVTVELTTVIPENAVLRKYSRVNGWSNFVINANNIRSKTSATCTDTNIWKTGLTAGATCLKLTIKDGSENDTDGAQSSNTGQVNGVIESTISIAVPTSNVGNNGDTSSGGGGCVYNANAPARFDIGFILLMVLSVHYLIRRRRRIAH